MTRPVKLGAYEFTAINAQYKIQRMTELFGPCGQGWGYESQSSEVASGGVVLAKVTVKLWWRQDDGSLCEIGPVTSACELMLPKPSRDGGTYIMVDSDAYKKAETDALTKAMTRIGMCADVFLGRFDDDKYVRETGEKFAAQDSVVVRALAAISAAETIAKLELLYKQVSVRHAEGNLSDVGAEQLFEALSRRREILVAKEAIGGATAAGSSGGGGDGKDNPQPGGDDERGADSREPASRQEDSA